MRILVLATTFPRGKGDTEPAFVLDLSQSLAERGHPIVALVPHAAGAAREEIFEEAGPAQSPSSPFGEPGGESQAGVRVIRFPYWPDERGQQLCYNGGALPNLRQSWMARLNLPAFLWQQRRWMSRLLRREAFDLIHSHWILPQGFFAVRRAGRDNLPVVVTAHAGDIFPLRRPGLRGVLRYTLNRAAAVTANSEATAAELLKAAPGVRPVVIPMGVDLERFASGGERAQALRQTLAPDGPLILTAGRFALKKGQAYLLRAMPHILRRQPKARLALIGFGPLEEALESEVRSLGLGDCVRFIGKVPHDEMPGYLAAADVFVLPSIVSPSGDTEGLGVVLLEALAAGTPVVASRVGGIPDIVKDGETGLLVAEKQPEALAEAILRLLEQPALGARLVEEGRRHIERHFSWPGVARRFERLFEQVLSECHSGLNLSFRAKRGI